MPEYKLNYFDLRIMGEAARWLFLISGTPWEDNRIPFAQWPELKGKTGWGQVPVLEVDGEAISQSLAILQFLGKKFDKNGSNDLEAARILEYGAHALEARNAFATYYSEADEGKRAIAKKTFMGTTLPTYLTRFNKIVEANGGNYLVGKRLSWVDLYLVNFIQIWEDNLDSKLLSSYPALTKLKSNVLSIPAIKDWVADRKDAFYNGVNM